MEIVCPECGHESDTRFERCQCRERNANQPPHWCQCNALLRRPEIVGGLRSPALQRMAQSFRRRV